MKWRARTWLSYVTCATVAHVCQEKVGIHALPYMLRVSTRGAVCARVRVPMDGRTSSINLTVDGRCPSKFLFMNDASAHPRMNARRAVWKFQWILDIVHRNFFERDCQTLSGLPRATRPGSARQERDYSTSRPFVLFLGGNASDLTCADLNNFGTVLLSSINKIFWYQICYTFFSIILGCRGHAGNASARHLQHAPKSLSASSKKFLKSSAAMAFTPSRNSFLQITRSQLFHKFGRLRAIFLHKSLKSYYEYSWSIIWTNFHKSIEGLSRNYL